MFLRFSWSWIFLLGLHDNGYMALINNNEFWMTVEHWERFGVLRVLRVTRWLMAVVNFMINCAVIISVAQSISASAWSKNTFRAVKILSAALIPLTLATLEDAERTPRGHSSETSADGDGDNIPDVLHHQSCLTLDKCHQKYYSLWRMSQNRSESQLRILIEFLHDFQISAEVLKLSQWTNGRADPPDTRTLHLLQDFRQNWSKVVTFNICFEVYWLIA